MNGRRAKLGVVGLGVIGSWHAELLADGVPGAELAAVVDRRDDLAEAIATRYGVPRKEYGELLADPAIDGVLIATPAPSHPALVEEAARAGKQIFCEKPLSFSLEETARAMAAAEDHGVLLQVGFHRRFHPAWREAREQIEAGTIGRVVLYRSSNRFWADYPDLSYVEEVGNLFRDMMVHEFDMARWLVDEIAEVNAWGVNPTKPEMDQIGDTQVALVQLRFDGGALGSLDGSMLCGYGYDCFSEVVGTDGTLRIGLGARTTDLEVIVDGVKRVGHSSRDPSVGFREAYVNELAHFASSILEGRRPEVGGLDSLAASAVAEAASESLLSGQATRVQPLESFATRG
jgi:predicted dehydrogenase